MSTQKSKNPVNSDFFPEVEESPLALNDFSIEMPSWAVLPQRECDQDSQKKEKEEIRKEIPGFPTSVTLTWAYFPDFSTRGSIPKS